MKKFRQLRLSLLTTLLLMIFPVIVFAQEIGDIIADIATIIGLVTPVVVALALLYFFWGLAKFILNADNEQARTDGKQIMIWGIIALFVIVTVWGLVAVLNSTFVERENSPKIGPLVPTL